MAKSRAILDSNIFIAFYYREDTSHDEAVAVLDSLSDYDIIIPYCVIVEVTTILTYRLGKKAALNFLQDIQSADDTFIVNDEVRSEMEFFQKIDQNLSFTDTALIHLSQKYEAILLTFDAQLHRLYKKE